MEHGKTHRQQKLGGLRQDFQKVLRLRFLFTLKSFGKWKFLLLNVWCYPTAVLLTPAASECIISRTVSSISPFPVSQSVLCQTTSSVKTTGLLKWDQPVPQKLEQPENYLLSRKISKYQTCFPLLLCCCRLRYDNALQHVSCIRLHVHKDSGESKQNAA